MRDLVDLLNNKLSGQKLINRQHSNREAYTYTILNVYEGVSGIKVAIKYEDGVEESIAIGDMRKDEVFAQSQPKCTSHISDETNQMNKIRLAYSKTNP